MPDQDPRQATPRPRPAGTASTGQHPVARTRETTAGPTGTARIPIVRQSPAGPAAPRPGVRQPDDQRPSTQPPVRSRLRTPPPAPPQQAATFSPAAPVRRPVPNRPVATPPRTRPFSQLVPAPTPLPPTPTEFVHAPAPTTQRRHGAKGVLAALAVIALGVLWGLPAFASKAFDAPPVAGIELGDVQHLEVGEGVTTSGAGAGAAADAVSGSLPVAAAPSWIKPVQGHLGDPFGPRLDQPVAGVSLFHRGQDIVAPCGQRIHAAASGTVTSATYWGTYGNWILIDHGDGVAVGYAHESQMLVSVGQHVSVGQVIGLVGQTGAATGCHLHLEVHVHQIAINPVPFFTGKGISLG
jgi:murein DD-endopeptidase MepM/ murein hydrolase activator NlpD